MELTYKQEQGLKIALERYKNKEPYTCIGGYAGSGKSTLVRFIIDALKLNPKYVAYISFTGKASMVLREKGCPNAMTAHRLLYKSYPKKDGTFRHIPLWPLEQRYDLIVVDEVSMLPLDMWNLLLSHHIPVIALGDPGQLPPIDDTQDNHVLDNPHIFLDEIMRQAQESEIIRLSMDVREGKTPFYQKGSEVMVIPKKEVIEGMFLWADQILVGKNITRVSVNDAMRKVIFGKDVCQLPVDGDKIICLRNDWDTTNVEGDALVNGEQGIILNPQLSSVKYVGKIIKADFQVGDTTPYRDLNIDYKIFNNHEKTITGANYRKIPKYSHPKEFDYGYAITVHKSQGSEWNKVIVYDEYLAQTDHNRWLYTAITRASERLIIVK